MEKKANVRDMIINIQKELIDLRQTIQEEKKNMATLDNLSKWLAISGLAPYKDNEGRSTMHLEALWNLVLSQYDWN